MRVNVPGLPMVIEPKTTGMTVLGELMFANVLLRFDSIQVEEILAIECWQQLVTTKAQIYQCPPGLWS